MMTDEELREHKKAALFSTETPWEKLRAAHFKKQPPIDLTKADNIVAVLDLNAEFAETLEPGAVKAVVARVTEPYALVASVPFRDAHRALIDQLLINPGITNKALAHATGYTPGWVSRVLQSDAFQAKLAEGKNQVSALVVNSIEARMKGMTAMALEVLETKLALTESTDLAIEVLAITTKALGMGVKANAVPVVQNSFIVHMPTKIQSATEWAAQQTGTGLGATKGEVSDADAVELVFDLPEPAEASVHRASQEVIQERVRGLLDEKSTEGGV